MSHQGNIRSQDGKNDPKAIWVTSTRWSGSQTPFIVQEALQRMLSIAPDGTLRRYWTEERDFLAYVVKHSSMEAPIRVLGNDDTPTVVVDWDSGRVMWEDHYDQVPCTLEQWPFEDYLKLNIRANLTFQDRFEC